MSCLHLRDFRPDLGQKIVDAIVSCISKNTESTTTILGYRHLDLVAIPAAVFRMGGGLCSKITSTQKHRNDEKASYSRQRVDYIYILLLFFFCPVVVYINRLVRKLAGGMCWFWVCAALYDKIRRQVRCDLSTANRQFAKVPPFFLIVKIITVF